MVGRYYRRYLPLMPAAIERFDLSGYDLVLSSSHAVAKGVLTHAQQLHICYLQARNLKYAYEDRASYPGGGLLRLAEDLLLSRIRVWDTVAARRPDVTIANSHYVSAWHRHRHGISSRVIYPPVDTDFFSGFFSEDKQDYYVTVGRLEPYKRMDVLVEAFRTIPARLLVIGDGTQRAALGARATPNIEFLGSRDRPAVAQALSHARAFVFASREDFGIAPVEAQACGTPVIALRAGGVPETIRGLGVADPTGILFESQTPESLAEAVRQFECEGNRITAAACLENAARFGTDRFRREFEAFVRTRFENFTHDAYRDPD